MTPWQRPGPVTLSSGSPPCSTDARRRHTPPESRRATRRALRWRGPTGTHDSARKSNAPVGLPGLGRRTQTGSAVRLKGHIDPYSNEQGDGHRPDHAKNQISPAPTQLPHPMRYISLPHRRPSRGHTRCSTLQEHRPMALYCCDVAAKLSNPPLPYFVRWADRAFRPSQRSPSGF